MEGATDGLVLEIYLGQCVKDLRVECETVGIAWDLPSGFGLSVETSLAALSQMHLLGYEQHLASSAAIKQDITRQQLLRVRGMEQ